MSWQSPGTDCEMVDVKSCVAVFREKRDQVCRLRITQQNRVLQRLPSVLAITLEAFGTTRVLG